MLKLNDGPSTTVPNFLYNSELDKFNENANSPGIGNCDEIEAKAKQLMDLASLVKDDGDLILAACDIGKGIKGREFGRNIATLIGNRLNIFLPTGWINAVMGRDQKKGDFDSWAVDSFKVDITPGWLHVTPQGRGNYIDAIDINLEGTPIHLVPHIVK